VRRWRCEWAVGLLLTVGVFVASPGAQGQFWVLVNGALNYTGPVTVNGSLQTTAAGGIGVGNTPTSLRGLNYWSGNLTDTAANAYYGAYLFQTLAPTTNTSASLTGLATEVKWLPASGTATMVSPLIGLQTQAYSTATATGVLTDIRGISTGAYNSGAGAFTTLYGYFDRWGLTSTGNITTAYGLYLNPFTSGAGTIGTNYGIRSLTPTNGGPITTNYGARFDSAGAAGITHAYGLNVQETTGALTTNVSFSIGTEPTGTSYSFYNGSTVASKFLGSVDALAYQTSGVPGVGFALSHANPANQTGNGTATLKMNGLGAAGAPCTITPTSTGRVVFTITGDLTNSVILDGVTYKLVYGTGGAPANAAAATGTVISATRTAAVSTAAQQQGFSVTASVTGLSLVATWFDLQIADVTGGTASVLNIDCTAHEI